MLEEEFGDLERSDDGVVGGERELAKEGREIDRGGGMKAYAKDTPPMDMREYILFIDTLKKMGAIRYPIYSEVMTRLRKRREILKKEQKALPDESPEQLAKTISQGTVKLIMVSSYGAAGYRYTRYFNKDFVNAITSTGQLIIGRTIERCRNKGFMTIYGDTDSVFLLPELGEISAMRLSLIADKFAADLTRETHAELIERFALCEAKYCVKIEPKCVYSSVLFTGSKKKYRGEVVWEEGKYKKATEIIGFESRRTDAFTLLAEAQKAVQEILINEAPEKIDVAVMIYLQKLQERMYTGVDDEKLVIQKSVMKEGGISAYKTTTPQLRAAKILDEQGLFRNGDKVQYVVVKDEKGNQMETMPISPADMKTLPKIFPSGYGYYMKKISDMVQRLLGKDVEIEPPMPACTLDSFIDKGG